MFEKLSNYVNNKEFSLTLYTDKIHINNYQKIISLEDTYISVITNNKKILITGSNLVLCKLFDNEMLIKGTISKIEVLDV